MSRESAKTFGQLPSGARLERIRRSPQFKDGRFSNPVNRSTHPSLRMALRLLPRWMFGGQERTPGRLLPTVRPDPSQWNVKLTSGWRATWLGHSTSLLELGGIRVLTDPVWSNRVSPLRFAGPVRFHPPPMTLAELPSLDAVLISHDHYDHLDMETVRTLARSGVTFVVSLGVGSHLESWGVRTEQIVELDWWESHRLPGSEVDITAAPAHHLSGRNAVTGRDATLWSSFAIRGGPTSVYFGGDAGVPTNFAEIGRRFGPFDLTLLPIGAYGDQWPDIHLTPEEAVSAQLTLSGKQLLPIHWGTFNLAFHNWYEPPQRLLEAARSHEVPVTLPMPGQTVSSDLPAPVSRWWEA